MCLKRPVPAPLPGPALPENHDREAKTQAALQIFATFGRWGDFATTADLTNHASIAQPQLEAWLAAHPAKTPDRKNEAA